MPYDFVRLDDVYEYLTPALNKYGVDFEVLGEVSTQLDASGNPAIWHRLAICGGMKRI